MAGEDVRLLPVGSPSPPRGEGRGEGEAPRAFPRIVVACPPHPALSPGGEGYSRWVGCGHLSQHCRHTHPHPR
ncbi:hypothetical protein E6C72_27045 [Azospirillum sp. TSH100]|nr:hypothetical protein E6C72_27045 [Azospirillum sp. TSH100]